MTTLLHILIAVVLLGDYLMLSANRLVLGSNTNWLLLVGIAQALAVVLAVVLGRARALRMNIPMLGFLGLGLVMLVHTANRAIMVGDFDDYGTVKTLTFFAINGHHLVIQGLLHTFEVVPPGGADISLIAGDRVAPFFTALLTVAVRVALPVTGALILTDLAMGLAARTTPQMNVLVVGFPAKAASSCLTMVSFSCSVSAALNSQGRQ